MHRFYVPDFPAHGDLMMPDDEAQHLARVLRLSTGDRIAVFDGKGREALARVASIASRRVRVAIIEPRTPAPEPRIHITLAQALLKSDKMEDVIRDAVMLGATAIQPVVSRRTDVPKAALKTGARKARWDRTVIASVKQCGRAVVPPVFDPVDFGQLLADRTPRLRIMFVEPSADGSAADVASLGAEAPVEAIVMIGPEGGWDAAEIAAASSAGVRLVTLGRQVLRADAAGLIAMAVLRYAWRDL